MLLSRRGLAPIMEIIEPLMMTGSSMLATAVISGWVDGISQILKDCVLGTAAEHGRREVVELLIKHKADANRLITIFCCFFFLARLKNQLSRLFACTTVSEGIVILESLNSPNMLMKLGLLIHKCKYISFCNCAPEPVRPVRRCE